MTRRWVFAIGALAIAGCKPSRETARPPAPTTLEEAQARLAANADDLRAAGVDVPAPAGYDEDAGDAGGDGEEVAPTDDAAPPEPGPAPTTAVDGVRADPAEAERSVVFKESKRERRAARNRTSTRCERVCGLAEATCDLQVQICELSDRHPGDVRYADTCARAELQCDAAARECQICDD